RTASLEFQNTALPDSARCKALPRIPVSLATSDASLQGCPVPLQIRFAVFPRTSSASARATTPATSRPVPLSHMHPPIRTVGPSLHSSPEPVFPKHRAPDPAFQLFSARR